ncbi:MAG: hypothetical protein OXN96_15290 [Bryobacterales bacterium]|nr:hypothetical protein [Bryobacterales bacterium]
MRPRKPDPAKLPERSRDPDFVGAEAALRRAAERARRRAAECGTAIAIFKDGKVVWVKPDSKTPS